VVHGRPVLDADRQVTAVVRVRISQAGRLVYGEAIEAESERFRRFTDWSELATQLRSLIEEAVIGRANDGRGSPS
jgi:hypothetical protein